MHGGGDKSRRIYWIAVILAILVICLIILFINIKEDWWKFPNKYIGCDKDTVMYNSNTW